MKAVEELPEKLGRPIYMLEIYQYALEKADLGS